MKELDAVPVLTHVARLGEGPVWDERAEVLWWIDWYGAGVFRSRLQDDETEVFSVGDAIAAVALSDGDAVWVAMGHGFFELDPTTGRVREVGRAEPSGDLTRMNDGKCDATGRFWAGTMSLDGHSPIGALYALQADGSVRRVLDGVINSNGMCWSADNKTAYYVDSGTQRIDAFDYDLAEGNLTNRRVVKEFRREEGTPDGLTIDAEGYLWVALWDGWQVRRYSTDGELDCVIPFPVARPTCCTFAGEDFRDLLITTAMPDSVEERADQPLAGRVFRARADTPGLPAYRRELSRIER